MTTKSACTPDNVLSDTQLNQLPLEARAVLSFWFDPNNKPSWFVKNDDFDAQIRDDFGAIWHAAIQSECSPWRYGDKDRNRDANKGSNNNQTDHRAELAGRLAEIIVIDQFSRNLNRGQAAAFNHDTMALVLAQEAVMLSGFDDLPMPWRKFMIMPVMHSESLVIHERYLHLFEQLDDAETLDFEHRHADILRQFGRYPHRNEALGRDSTAEEMEFLQQPGSSF